MALPGADTTTQWFEDNYPGDVMNANCGVLHTTEGTNWPDYSGGAIAPNATAKPNIKKQVLEWRQHFPVNRSSRALVNQSGGVETNTLNVFQIELIGTCDPVHKKTWNGLQAGVDYIYWPEAADWVLRELGKMLAWLDVNEGIPATSPVKGRWTPYPDSYGPGGQRFSSAEWLNLYGWCGHEHVPENVHGDPGALDFPTVANYAKSFMPPVVPPPGPVPIPTKWPTLTPLNWRRHKDAVVKLQHLLNVGDNIPNIPISGKYDKTTAARVKQFKSNHPSIPGKSGWTVGQPTWAALLEKKRRSQDG